MMTWQHVHAHIGWPRRIVSRVSWGLIGLVLLCTTGLVLIFLLAQSTQNQAIYERYYEVLFVINVAIVVLLLGIILWAFGRLLQGLRRGKFGSRLWFKLATIFIVLGLVPGAIIYTVSYQFVNRFIESWFDVRVEEALSAGLNLSLSLLDSQSLEAKRKTRLVASELASLGAARSVLSLERIREQYDFRDVVIWEDSKVFASAGQAKFLLSWPQPSTQILNEANTGEPVASFEGLESEVEESVSGEDDSLDARIQTWMRISDFHYENYAVGGKDSYLVTVQSLDQKLAKDALAIQDAYREYQERFLVRQGLRRMYIGTLSLTLFLAIFMAILLAYWFGRRLVQPLLFLAEGVQQVAQGNLQVKPISTAKDEIGDLTQSFVQMTQQLLVARQAVQQNMQALELSHNRVQTILDNLTAAVMLLDDEGRLVLANPSASRILRTNFVQQQGKYLEQIAGMEVLGHKVQNAFANWRQQTHDSAQEPTYWQQSFELDKSTILIARGTRMGENELLLMFDDISEVVSAERIQAWAEVARRLAHEIKNPLTPIQLSAERLGQKLKDKLPLPEKGLLEKSVHTIVFQVESMKRMVNAFRDFGRLPAAELRPVVLDDLVLDIVNLYSDSTVPIACDLKAGGLSIAGDAQQLRQVIHNLLLNAQDACEGRAQALIQIQTRVSNSGTRIRLIVQDSGPGFDKTILARAFEPYISTKSKGTGLGLAVVKKIADDHHAKIVLTNLQNSDVVLGAQVTLIFGIANLI